MSRSRPVKDTLLHPQGSGEVHHLLRHFKALKAPGIFYTRLARRSRVESSTSSDPLAAHPSRRVVPGGGGGPAIVEGEVKAAYDNMAQRGGGRHWLSPEKNPHYQWRGVDLDSDTT